MASYEWAKSILDSKYLFLVIAGSLIYTIGFNIFILPCDLYSGGFIGISQLIVYFMEHSMGMNVKDFNYTGVIYLLLNIPLLYMALKVYGTDFIVKSIFCVASYSFFLSAVPVPQVNYLPDTITACVAGGILCGIGASMTLMSKGSGGGEGILGLLISHKYSNMSVGKVFYIVDILVFSTCIYLYSLHIAVYSIFFAVLTAFVLDKLYLPNIKVTMMIISKKERVEELVFKVVNRGVTKIKGVGAYSGDETNIFLTVVSKSEANKLRSVLQQFDPNIFIIEDENVEVAGNFKKRL